MNPCPLPEISDSIVELPGILKARETELDRSILNRPSVIAQRVEVELIKRLQREAPWLIPML